MCLCHQAVQFGTVLAKGRWCSAAGKVTVGLASYWPCVTDFSGLSTYRLTAKVREMSTPPTPIRAWSALPFFTLYSAVINMYNRINIYNTMSFSGPAIRYIVPNIWNSLPDSCWFCQTLYVFNQSYCNCTQYNGLLASLIMSSVCPSVCLWHMHCG